MRINETRLKARPFLDSDDGATSIEYALIAAFVGLGLVVPLTELGPELAGIFTQIGTFLSSV